MRIQPLALRHNISEAVIYTPETSGGLRLKLLSWEFSEIKAFLIYFLLCCTSLSSLTFSSGSTSLYTNPHLRGLLHPGGEPLRLKPGVTGHSTLCKDPGREMTPRSIHQGSSRPGCLGVGPRSPPPQGEVSENRTQDGRPITTLPCRTQTWTAEEETRRPHMPLPPLGLRAPRPPSTSVPATKPCGALGPDFCWALTPWA